METWKDIIIEGYDVRYQISNFGRVKSIARYSDQGHWLNERIMKQYDNKKGYKYIDLYVNYSKPNCPKKRIYIHRLVAEYFVDNPYDLPEVDHIDTNRSNNVYTNLRWCTHLENYQNETTKSNQKKSHAFQQIKIAVYKNNELLHIFESYQDLDYNSEKIIGEKLWSIYARQVANGKRRVYKGYFFKIINNVNPQPSL